MSTIYLENYVESTASLPAELQRMLATIKDLDERSDELSEAVRQSVELVLSKPPQAARKVGQDNASEVAELRKTIEDRQRLVVQWAEERLALACSAYEMVDGHLGQLDRDLTSLTAELAANGAPDADGGADAYPTPPEEPRRARHAEPDPDRQAVQETRRRDRDLQAAERSRRETAAAAAQDTTPYPGAAGVPQHVTSSGGAASAGEFAVPLSRAAAASSKQASKGKRERDDGGVSGASSGGGPGLKRRAAAQAALATVSSLAAEEEAGGGAGGPVLGAGDVLLGGVDPAPPSHTPYLPPGIQHHAISPQAAGRLLTKADITPALRGRRAELFWPADEQWYMIEIQSVDMLTHKAAIMYTTGETEELDLDEIVREGHMSLITATF